MPLAVHTPTIDIGERERVLRHQLLDRRSDRDAHFLGCDRRKVHPAKQSENGQATARGNVRVRLFATIDAALRPDPQ
jgi:hypothetical protein